MTSPTDKKNLPEGLTTEDLYKIRKVGSPIPSPDNQYIIYHSEISDRETDSRENLIILLSPDQGSRTTIARGIAHAWSPDGAAFLYETETGALCIYTLNTATSRFLVQRSESSYFINHLALNNCAWSPDGQLVAYVAAETPVEKTPDPAVRVIDDLLYKSKGGRNRPVYADQARTHIFLIPAAGGTPQLLTPGPFNEHSLTWSGDSRQVAFVSNRTNRPDDTQQSELWKVDIRTKNITKLTNQVGQVYQPAWSPDNQLIAFLATSGSTGTNDSPAEDTHLALVPAEGGRLRYVTKHFDRRVGQFCWHPSGKSIFFTAGNHGDTAVFRIGIDQENAALMQGRACQISEFCVDSRGGELVFAMADSSHPAEIFQSQGSTTRQLTRENNAWLAAKTLRSAETFWFESHDGTQVQGWLMPPVRFEKAKKFPLILVIHGGPHNMFGYDFDERMHLLSQAGYAVVYFNPRGSHGYGQAFSNGTLMNWGGGDFRDLMAGIDFVLEKNTWLDAQRLGVTGQSYGGYMTNWIITQTSRFKAAVTDGGISNLVSFSGTSLYHSLMESEFGGRAYDRFELLWRWSPLRYAGTATTPTLLLHGETDNEVPFSQAEEMYIALKKKGVDTQLVQYTGEGHGWRPELSPRNKADLYNRMIRWFDTYLKNRKHRPYESGCPPKPTSERSIDKIS